MVNSKNIKVTVTIPVFNSASFIKESIESVLGQDYADFELLILNDGSADNSYKIIKKYKVYPKVRLYSQAHKGAAVARNKLLRLSHGPYISPHDADDIMLPGKLKEQAAFLDNNPDIGVVCGKIVVTEGEYPKGCFGGPYDKKKDLLKNTIAHCSTMIRKSYILKVGGYNKTLSSCIDYDLWLKLAEVTDFVFLDKFFCICRKHKDSLSCRINKKEYINNLRKIKNAVLKRRLVKIL